MQATPVHVIDFEGSRQSGVVEYGVVTLQGQVIASTETRICAAQGAITDRDRGQHGISEARAAQESPFSEAWSLFAELRESGPLCAHNAAVEDGLLCAQWACPRSSPDFADPGQSTASWGPWLDTLYLYRRVYPQLESHKLQALIVTFDLQETLDAQARVHCPEGRRRYHCALYDALASALLLRRLLVEPSLGELSLHWLLLNSAASDASRDALGQQELF